MSDINQLKHFDALDYKGEYFTNELKDGEEFLYSTIKIQDDSKLYTRNSKCVEVDESLNQIFIDLVLDHFKTLWDNDLINDDVESFNREIMLDNINAKFAINYPEQSAKLKEETGGYFTLDDLDCIKVKFEIEKPIGDLTNNVNFDLINTFFNHQHEMTRSSSVNKTTMKNILNNGRDISIAKFVENTSLIIK